MNERIQELIEESKCLSDGYNTGAVDLDKFAELVLVEVYAYILNATLDDQPWPDFATVKRHFFRS